MSELNFIRPDEISRLEALTGFCEREILSDFLLFCAAAEMPIILTTWTEYKDETENQF